ncbi:EAL domain-containing protein [Paenibacillus chartarius]|uniref:EAL domain-containing protein n=1 Tax=Paenibacillus chartarius TaxID=747481 RepID=A0ABV6DQ21_9BACL
MRTWLLHEKWLTGFPYPLFILNEQGMVEEQNAALSKLVSYTCEELLQIPFADLVVPEHRNRFRRALEQAKQGEIRSIDVDVMAKNDKRKSLQIVLSLCYSEGDKHPRIHVISRDITSSQILKKELIQSKLQLEHIFETLNVAIWSVEPGTRKLLQLSLGAEKVYGHPVQAFYSEPDLWQQMIHPDDYAAVMANQGQLQSGRSIVHEYRIISGQGEIRWIHDRVFPELDNDGNIVSLTGIAFDMTEQKLMKDQIRHMALHDPATGLPNRTMLEEYFRTGCNLAEQPQPPIAIVSLVAMPLDMIADTLGQSLADEALRLFAERAAELLPNADLICRTGDYTISIVCKEADTQKLYAAAELFFRSLDRTFPIGPYEVVLSGAAGISTYPGDGTDAGTLLNRAQSAMHRARKKAVNTVMRYKPHYEEECFKAFRLETDMFGALERGEFVLLYQPKIDLTRMEIIGMEALLHWNHAEFGLIKPSEFIALAQELNLIIPIGEWVLRSVCRLARECRELGLPPLRMGVNVSPQEILQADFVGKVMTILAETEMDASCLELEVTEHTMKQEKHIQVLKKLQAAGVTITIDNFGTGYSSLQSIKSIKLGVLKLDKMYIRSMTESEEDCAIVDAVIHLCHKLGVKVVAEGVETKEQMALLRKLGCDGGQGYALGMPVPGEQLKELLQYGVTTQS